MKAALLLRVLPNNVKTHLTMSINDESTYDQMREVIVRWERSSQKWSSQIVSGLSSTKTFHHDDGGQADMEIDRVKGKWGSKGKGKYEQKGGKGKDTKGKGKGHQSHQGKGTGKYGGGRSGGGKASPWGKDGKSKGGKDHGKGKGEKGKKGKSQGGGRLHPEACQAWPLGKRVLDEGQGQKCP